MLSEPQSYRYQQIPASRDLNFLKNNTLYTEKQKIYTSYMTHSKLRLNIQYKPQSLMKFKKKSYNINRNTPFSELYKTQTNSNKDLLKQNNHPKAFRSFSQTQNHDLNAILQCKREILNQYEKFINLEFYIMNLYKSYEIYYIYIFLTNTKDQKLYQYYKTSKGTQDSFSASQNQDEFEDQKGKIFSSNKYNSSLFNFYNQGNKQKIVLKPKLMPLPKTNPILSHQRSATSLKSDYAYKRYQKQNLIDIYNQTHKLFLPKSENTMNIKQQI